MSEIEQVVCKAGACSGGAHSSAAGALVAGVDEFAQHIQRLADRREERVVADEAQ